MKNNKNIIGIFVGIIIIIIDQITKALVVEKYITVIPNFLDFTYTENYGMAFGMGRGILILLVNVLLIAGIIIYIIKERKKIKNFLPYSIILRRSIW